MEESTHNWNCPGLASNLNCADGTCDGHSVGCCFDNHDLACYPCSGDCASAANKG